MVATVGFEAVAPLAQSPVTVLLDLVDPWLHPFVTAKSGRILPPRRLGHRAWVSADRSREAD
eukprot:CAMPEP_0172812618 /NCGR_PEP_ID=MMETSP1075-20121228/10151_1 /TAXON_ID=2916 /ORGANISM="Ceratium fusus, Strain PA161109" /LENGTH=61 /DNA_ID=CAMNT_0013652201 /DNA_START=649 /DNA_END=834 /DNA_ORIENTATION=+